MIAIKYAAFCKRFYFNSFTSWYRMRKNDKHTIYEINDANDRKNSAKNIADTRWNICADSEFICFATPGLLFWMAYFISDRKNNLDK